VPKMVPERRYLEPGAQPNVGRVAVAAGALAGLGLLVWAARSSRT
jgi:hypothetical protein